MLICATASCMSCSVVASTRDDKGQIVLGVAGQLQHGFKADVLRSENSREFRDDTRPVIHTETKIVRTALQRDPKQAPYSPNRS